ncbi:hypothetical protein [uncultured Jatrophihabitans sp.]|uniref:hypothetical protein n=1 Tax=uncultured Jatrophihabitans sp. TaxID=1610747 RepID=UPI0035CB346C
MSDVVRSASGFGVRVGLRVAADDADVIGPALPYWWHDDGLADEPERIWPVTPSNVESVMGELELHVAEHAPGLVFVHAAVVAVDGHALLLPGRSHCGKSTLAAELVRRGAAYGSDEYAVLQPDGLVRGYPRPLALRTSDGPHRVSAGELGGTVMPEPLPVGAVAELRYEPGAPVTLMPVSAADAALRLIDNAVCAASRPADTLTAVTGVVDGARAVAGTRADAADVADELLAMLR